MFFRMMGGLMSEIVDGISGVDLGALIDRPLAILFNAGAFVLLIRVVRRSVPSRWFVVGLLCLTALYLSSYFFVFPTRDCP
jgi:hypothetical protein